MQTTGRYRLLTPIEAGIPGTVFRAYDTALGTFVTLQVVSRTSDRIEPSAASESRLWMGLDHPNLARVLDVSPDEGRLVVVLEPLEGRTLWELIRQRQPSRLQDKLALMGQVCAGLHHAHLHGIVHGDVNPRNIFVSPDEHVKILGPTLGGRTDLDPGRGAVPHHPGYRAPEQAGGRLDVRSDIFSVGAVCCELMGFGPPLDQDDPKEVLDRIRWDKLPPLDEINSAIPSDLVAIVERALRKDPARRFPSLAEMGAALTFVRRRLTDQALVMGELADLVTRARELRLAGSPDALPAEDVTTTAVRPQPWFGSSPRPAGDSVATPARPRPRSRISRWRTVAVAAGLLIAVGLGIEPLHRPPSPPPPLASLGSMPPDDGGLNGIAAVRLQMVAARKGANKAQAGRRAPRVWAAALATQRDAEAALSHQAFDRARTLFASAEGAYHDAWRRAVTVAAVERARLALLQRAVQTAESDTNQARWEAEGAGASRYAVTTLELARERETEARVAREGRKYELTERRFREAEHAYRRAALEAQAVGSRSLGERLLAAVRHLEPAEVSTTARSASWESRDARGHFVVADR